MKNISVDEIAPQVYEQENGSLEFAITHSIRYTESILMSYKKLNVLRIDYIEFNVRQKFYDINRFLCSSMHVWRNNRSKIEFFIKFLIVITSLWYNKKYILKCFRNFFLWDTGF